MEDQIKPITVKAKVSDKNFIDDLAKTDKCTMPVAFAKVITLAKQAQTNGNIVLNLEKNIEELKAEIDKMATDYLVQSQQVSELLAENEKLKNQTPQTIEVEKIVEKTVEKLVEKPLTGHQFICELDEETALHARKIRSFAKQDGIVTTTDGFEYANQLANYSIKKILSLKYDHLL